MIKEEYQGEQFQTFLKTFWNKHGRGIAFPENLSAKSLCEGVCDVRMLRYLKKGERVPDKLLWERLLERLGISVDEHTLLMGYDRYDRWKARMRIVHSINWENTKEAMERLNRYKSEPEASPFERQFCLAMEAQIKYCMGADREELSRLYKEAVELTMPEAESKPLDKMALAPKELNLILEAERFRKEGERPERYEEVIKYLEKGSWDELSMAGVYPKTVYYLCRSAEMQGAVGEECRWEAQRLLEYCDQALEYLRKSERMYYMWEILDMQVRLQDRISGDLIHQGEDRKADNLRTKYRKNEEWKQALESIYGECRVPKETFVDCYLYVEKGVFCFNDVIRIRRRMLEITEDDLCAGICDKRTLKRLEKRKMVTQRAIVEALLVRLGLPREFMYTELVTDSSEARQLMRKIKYWSWRDRWDNVDELLWQIKKMVNLSIPHNRQTLMQYEVLSLWNQRLLTNEDYCQKMREVLEITLPFEAFLKEGEKYLTYEEQVCIQNMMLAMEKTRKEYQICMERFGEMYKPYINEELQETVAGAYEMVMGTVRSDWGDKGEYVRPDLYNEYIIEGCLRFKRMAALPDSLYGRWQSYVKQKKKGVLTDRNMEGRVELERCIILSQICKQTERVQRYQEKLDNL